MKELDTEGCIRLFCAIVDKERHITECREEYRRRRQALRSEGTRRRSELRYLKEWFHTEVKRGLQGIEEWADMVRP